MTLRAVVVPLAIICHRPTTYTLNTSACTYSPTIASTSRDRASGLSLSAHLTLTLTSRDRVVVSARGLDGLAIALIAMCSLTRPGTNLGSLLLTWLNVFPLWVLL
jgi:hypothetical protein